MAIRIKDEHLVCPTCAERLVVLTLIVTGEQSLVCNRCKKRIDPMQLQHTYEEE